MKTEQEVRVLLNKVQQRIKYLKKKVECSVQYEQNPTEWVICEQKLYRYRAQAAILQEVLK